MDARYELSRKLFQRGLALVWLIAFVSLGVQVRGLFGEHGVQPAWMLLDWVASSTSSFAERLYVVPSVFWLDSGDGALVGACVLGAVAALALLLDVAPGLACLVAWGLYVSLISVGGVFLALQWDALLAEAGLLAVFYAPWRLRRPGERSDRAPRLARWCLWWLVARLMLESGLVKLASGDPTWRDLSALDFHFETQPLPTPLAFLAHHAPAWTRRAAIVATYAIELALPVAILFGVRGRRVAAVGFVGLQVAIAATGNYGFFNLLTAVLALALLDDAVLTRVPKLAGRPPRAVVDETWERNAAGQFLIVIVALATVPACVDVAARAVGLAPLPALARALEARLQPLASFNSYGLFAVMTTERSELVLEGTRDGVEWRRYPFRFQPGEVDDAPSFVAPHLPRLDWALCFAALGSPEHLAAAESLAKRLLAGEPTVLALLAAEPFSGGPPPGDSSSGAPPKRVRAVRWLYRFAEPGSDAWWTREEVGRAFEKSRE
ncbi:MAG: lipase maturation factor family protein [Planctomycetes bacterium]|nr:lipase maturation factor family protein [Planctomycetota bacterium]